MRMLRIREVKHKMHIYINNMIWALAALAFTVMVWGGVLKINI